MVLYRQDFFLNESILEMYTLFDNFVLFISFLSIL